MPHLRAGVGELGVPYRSALCLVRLHGDPLGLVEVELPLEGVSPPALAAQIEAELGAEIGAHLDRDGLARRPLRASGLIEPELPACQAARNEFLGRATLVSVVVPTRDRPQLAAEAVGSLLESRYPRDRFEVLVVDNRPPGEGAGGGEVDEEPTGALADPRVRVVREPVPGGAQRPQRGRWRRRTERSSPIVDDDVVVDRDWLASRWCSAFEGEAERRRGLRPGEAAGAGDARRRPGTRATHASPAGLQRRAYDLGPNRPARRPTLPLRRRRARDRRQHGVPPRWCCVGSAASIPSSTPKALPNGSDVEALLRVLLRGWTVVHEPAAVVRHDHPREYAQLERRVYGYGLGLTAILTKALLGNPGCCRAWLRRLPRGLGLRAPAPLAQERRQGPRLPGPGLSRLECGGCCMGPVAYLRGRREVRGAGARRAAGPTRRPCASSSSPTPTRR